MRYFLSLVTLFIYLLLSQSRKSLCEFLPPRAYLNRTMYPPIPQYEQRPLLSMGILSDIQYANKKEMSRRHFRRSLYKLDHLVNELNANRTHLDLVFHIGDTVDEKMEENLKVVSPLLSRIKFPFYQLLGNHDYLSLGELRVEDVYRELGMPSRYYTLRAGKEEKFLLIALDSTDLCTYATRSNTARREESLAMSRAFRRRRNVNGFNGGIGKKQMEWLREQLDFATKKNLVVIVFSHMPMYPYGGYTNLWNDREVVDLLIQYRCIVAVVSGHTHHWNYGALKVPVANSDSTLHFITFSGVVQSPFTSWGFVEVYPSMLHVHGLTYGRAFSFHLPINVTTNHSASFTKPEAPCKDKCERRAVVLVSRGGLDDKPLASSSEERKIVVINVDETTAVYDFSEDFVFLFILVLCPFLNIFWLLLMCLMRSKRQSIVR